MLQANTSISTLLDQADRGCTRAAPHTREISPSYSWSLMAGVAICFLTDSYQQATSTFALSGYAKNKKNPHVSVVLAFHLDDVSLTGRSKVRGRQFCTQCYREKISLPRISSLWIAINPLRDMLKNKAIPKINNSDFEPYDRQLVCLNNWV